MKELLIGIACLCSINLFGQIDYFEANPEWRVDYETPSGDPDCLTDLHQRDYSIGGDSIHSNGYTYKKVFRDERVHHCNGEYFSSEFEILIRQNGKKVYVHDGDQDTLLYNFELNIGDTLPESYLYGNWSGTPEVVIEIDSIETEIGWLKRFHFENSYAEYLIEGVGHGKGLIDWMEVPLNYATRFICYSQNGEIQFDTNLGECYFTLSNDDILIQELELYPNPSKDKVYLDLEDEKFSSVQIFNALGQEQYVSINANYNRLELDIRHLPRGLYIIHLENDGFYSGRFVKD